MASSFILLVLSVAVLAATAHSRQAPFEQSSAWVLAMQKCKGSDTFTIHGLWPQAYYCSNTPFSESALNPIMNEMDEDWLSCPEYGGNNTKFWSHEWEKHGTCSGMGELSYFKQGLNLYTQFVDNCSSSSSSCELCFDAYFNPVSCQELFQF